MTTETETDRTMNARELIFTIKMNIHYHEIAKSYYSLPTEIDLYNRHDEIKAKWGSLLAITETVGGDARFDIALMGFKMLSAKEPPPDDDWLLKAYFAACAEMGLEPE